MPLFMLWSATSVPVATQVSIPKQERCQGWILGAADRCTNTNAHFDLTITTMSRKTPMRRIRPLRLERGTCHNIEQDDSATLTTTYIRFFVMYSRSLLDLRPGVCPMSANSDRAASCRKVGCCVLG